MQINRRKITYSTVGALIGALIGFAPGIDDVYRQTNYAIRAGAAITIGLFTPFAFVGAVTGVLVGARLAGRRKP